MEEELGGAGGPNDEGDEHAGSRAEEKRAAAEAVDDEELADGDDQVQDLEAPVDDELGVAIGDSHALEDDAEVVGGKPVARPLAEEAESEEDDEASTVGFCADKLHPAIALEFLLELDGVLDLLDL